MDPLRVGWETTWFFEMLDPGQFTPAKQTNDLQVRQMTLPLPSFIKYLWCTVGEPWPWLDRAEWKDDQWQSVAEDPDMTFWVGYTEGTPVGYFELHQTKDSGVEILYFGLLPQFLGRGYGGHLLNAAIETAWAMETHRVWVHTCSRDAPAAVPNYKARGFVLYDEQVTTM
jgi:GNAT superfamily N-acetyltransferase